MNGTARIGLLALAAASLAMASCGKEPAPVPAAPPASGAAPAASLAPAAAPARTDLVPPRTQYDLGDLPEDPAAFVRAIREGKEVPLASWKRHEGDIRVPPFGEKPPQDVGNPLPPGVTDDPQRGGTLVVQYNSGPKNINKIIENSAVTHYIVENTTVRIAHQDPVTFGYGRPSSSDPEHRFESVDPRDCASHWVIEDVVRRADGTFVAAGRIEDAGTEWQVTPVAETVGEERKALAYPKESGDRILEDTFWTVYLKPGIRWHDGAPFRAQDVAFSFTVTMNELVNSLNVRPYFEPVESCRALDDLTLRWVLKKPYFAIPDTILGTNLIVVPEHAYRDAFARARPGESFDPAGGEFARFFNTYTPLNEVPLGTGPYKVTEFVANQSVTLDRYEAFHGPPGPVDRIIWRIIPDTIAALQELKSGGIDFAAHGLTAEEFVGPMAEPKFQERFVRAHWFTPSVSFVAWNRRVPQLSDRRVRAALGMLANRPGFVEKKLHGLSVLASGDQFLSGPSFDRSVKPIAHDPKAAMELLDEAGWYDRDGDGVRDKDGKKLEFTLLVPSGSKTMKEFLPVWLEDLGKAGVRMKPELMEWAPFIERFENKKFDAITLSWAMDPESDPRQLWHSEFAGMGEPSSNVTSFGDARTDALIEAIQVTLDREVRARLQKALHRILDADQPYAFLWSTPEIAAYDRVWRGVRRYPRRPGFDLFEWYLPKGARKPR